MLHTAIEVLAVASGSTRAGLLWEAADGDVRYVAAAGGTPERLTLQAWLRAARHTPPAGMAEADDDTWVVPIRARGDVLLGALALSQDAVIDRETLRRTVSATVEHLLLLRDRTWQETARSSAFEALVEIGTQIQAEEVNADAVLRLIVDRARELCSTDVAWLALVGDDQDILAVEVASGTTTPEFLEMAVRVGAGIGGAAVAKGRTILVRDRDLYDNDWPESVRRTLEREGVVSVLCSPMLRGERMVGALYLGSRHHTDFGQPPTALLPALAAQAAIAVENGRLYRALAEQNATLERSAAIHRLLTDASLAGAGLETIGAELAQLVGRDIVVERSGTDAEMRFHAEPGPSRQDGILGPTAGEPDQPEVERVPITAGDEELGILRAVGDGELTALQRRALEHGATVIALELVKERAAHEVEWRLQGELLDEILQCRGEPTAGLVARAQHFGVDLGHRRRIAALRADDDQDAAHDYLRSIARSIPPPEDGDSNCLGSSGTVLVAKRGGLVVIAIPDAGAAAAEAWVRSLQRRAQRAGFACRAGLSDGHVNLPTALREAEAALGMAAGSTDPIALVTSERLGPLRFLLDAPGTSEMEEMVRRTLGALAVHDRQRQRAQLLPTVRAFLEADGHQAAAAAACHIHVSTLKYRMARAAEVLGRSPHDPDTRFELRLAFSVLDLLERLGVDPFADVVHPQQTNGR